MKIGIIIGSVREGRIGAGVADWVMAGATQRSTGFDYELIDLKSFELPMYTSPGIPAAGLEYDDERVRRWSSAIAGCDGFVFVTPEYNRGVPGAFKNAFDSIFPEWWNKPVAFVSYGTGYGFRVVEQWRLIVATANMFGIKAAVNLSTLLNFSGNELEPTERHELERGMLFDSLEETTTALAALRH